MRLAAMLLLTSVLFLAGCSSSSDPSEPRTYPDIDGLVVFYPFDGNLENAVGDDHGGSAPRAISYVDGPPGKPGQAVHLDVHDSITVPDHPDLDIQGDMSAGAWINPEASDRAWAALFCKDSNDSYAMGMWGGIADPETTDIIVRIAGWNESSLRLVPMGMDVWSHVAFTFSDIDDRLRIYLNGVKVDSGVVLTSLVDSDDDLLIGDHPALGEYKGAIDDLALFDRVLTDAEIMQLKDF